MKDKDIRTYSEQWTRLDNAAKLFPPTVKKSDTRVFRFYAELDHKIDTDILQEAANETTEEFPVFLSVLQRGLFWYYLESCGLKPIVTNETLPVCHEIYDSENPSLLFRISALENRINFEVFHALTDGTGALRFLKTLIYNYLLLRFPDEYREPPRETVDASISQRSDDSFRRYYDPKAIKKARKIPGKNSRAYNIAGESDSSDRLHVIEGICSVAGVRALAKKYGATITVYLTALYMLAIRKEMPLSGLGKPVRINIPVDLRQYFPSETAKNFFGMISAEYDFGKNSGELSDIIETLKKTFKEELTPEKLSARMNKMAAFEHNAARIAPLPFKNFVLRRAVEIKEKYETSVISNIGKITMPEEMEHHIDLFGILISTTRKQLCVCSFKDKLQLGFTSGFVDTDIERNFFRLLTCSGIEVEIRSNDFFAEDENE